MKITVQMKDPDTLHDAVHDAVLSNLNEVTGLDDSEYEIIAGNRTEAIKDECVHRWFRYGEYLAVEIDTEAWTITVLPAK